jgi:hemoglobin
MRHAEFVIDKAAHDAWLANMRAALDDVGLAADADEVIWTYLVKAANALINSG